ncbi:hypothetical protein PC116_g22474 [Phytophthora cactorum]|nr:hypothetical protein PC116_g22474 [Phytophthora cactorum]
MTGITNYRGAETAHRERRADFGYVGELSGENAGELLRGDPELFVREAVHSGRLGVMEWMV